LILLQWAQGNKAPGRRDVDGQDGVGQLFQALALEQGVVVLRQSTASLYSPFTPPHARALRTCLRCGVQDKVSTVW